MVDRTATLIFLKETINLLLLPQGLTRNIMQIATLLLEVVSESVTLTAMKNACKTPRQSHMHTRKRQA